jgi:hypothetical protein
LLIAEIKETVSGAICFHPKMVISLKSLIVMDVTLIVLPAPLYLLQDLVAKLSFF